MIYSKKIHFILLLAFWAFTWHAYAVGSIAQSENEAASSQSTLKRVHTSLLSYHDAKAPLKFKRRPFIVKDQLADIGPSFEAVPLAIFERLVLLESAQAFGAFHSSLHLRSPPVSA